MNENNLPLENRSLAKMLVGFSCVNVFAYLFSLGHGLYQLICLEHFYPSVITLQFARIIIPANIFFLGLLTTYGMFRKITPANSMSKLFYLNIILPLYVWRDGVTSNQEIILILSFIGFLISIRDARSLDI